MPSSKPEAGNREPKTLSPWLESVPDRRRYPPLSRDIEADVAVIGGGIVGVMAAWFLSREGFSVALLEKNRLATGDTGFTTGFLTRVPDTNISGLEKRYGAPFLKRLFAASRAAQERLIGLIREEGIDCGFSACSSFYCAYKAGDRLLAAEWDAVRKADALASFIEGKDAEASGIGMAAAIRFDGEGQFHSRKFVFGLLGKAKGISVFEETEAVSVEVGKDVVVKTPGGSVRAKKLVVATGLPMEQFSELRGLFEPKVTYALAARFDNGAPVPQSLFWDTYDPYFYYRRLDERTVILGGADRHPSERQGEPHKALEAFLKERFGGPFTVTHRWSGSLYDSEDGLPYAAEHPHYRGKVFVGSCCGFGGNGLVFGTLAASIIASLVSGKPAPEAELLSFSRTGAAIPEPRAKQAAGRKSRIFVRLASVNDVDEGVPFCAEAGGRKMALFRTAGGYFAIDNTCTHAGGSLCDGTQDEGVIQCPLHGARFEIKSGAVVGPPATKPIGTYRTRVSGRDIEVEVEAEGGGQEPAEPGITSLQAGKRAAAAKAGTAPGLFEGARKNIAYVLKASALALVFWSLQFLYQFFLALPGQAERAIILASSFSGATLIAVALMLGPVAVLWPKLNFTAHRRSFGVWGFTFIICHATAASLFYGLIPDALLANLNPYENPIVFGALAFSLFLPIYLTSTDWAVARLGFRNWKAVHRLVYLAFLFATLHYATINPDLFWSASKILLMAATAAAYALELAAYFRTITKKPSLWAILYGGGLVAFGAILLYLAFLG
ncbi:MAG: FAD-dependent oxidoreductase [Candidatus Micrarchaeota archaeon]